MRFSPSRWCAAVCTAALFLAAAPRASADPVSMFFRGTLNTPGVNPSSPTAPGGATTLNISMPGAIGNSVVAGPYYWDATPAIGGGNNPVATFCIELTQGIAAGNSYTYNLSTDLTTAPTIANNLNGTPRTAAEVTALTKAITALYGDYYQPSWAGLYAATPGTVTDTGYGAFQLALWELLYDGAGSAANRFTTGNLTSTDTLRTTAQNMITAVLNDIPGGIANFGKNLPGTQLAVLTANGAQDQIVLVPGPKVTGNGVPAPPALALAGIGFLALLGRGRLSRRTPAA